MTSLFKKLTRSPAPVRTPKATTPSSEKTAPKGKEPKLSYDERMMKKYNLTKQQLKQAKKEAHQQKENWIKYKKEQVLDIFGSKNKYVSKSASSDLMHPSKYRAVATVVGKDGKEIAVEFGKRLEILLDTFRPNNKFAVIRSQVHIEKSLASMANRFKARHKIKLNLNQSKDKKQKYDQMKGNVEPTSTTVGQMSSVQNSNRSDTDVSGKDDPEFNTTDTEQKLFLKDWYNKSSSRSLVKAGANKKGLGQTFWMADEDEDNSQATDIEDEDEKKYSVTSDVLLDVLENKREVKPVNFPVPKEDDVYRNLESIVRDMKKSSKKEVVFANTVKGTIEFDAKQNTSKSAPKESTDKIEWYSKTETHVFQGPYMKRPNKAKTGYTKKVEPLEDIVRVEE
ncbi:unnamed protein product [Caenorhabditis bovis]|uniref:Uncharacterized protein n=1 Tax=Caenorhabditis bovis TaxID=2654633 RepID=A0A8S1F5W5_9PELO|nr:unnamed protein product [Caenorhabditis bovis]